MEQKPNRVKPENFGNDEPSGGNNKLGKLGDIKTYIISGVITIVLIYLMSGYVGVTTKNYNKNNTAMDGEINTINAEIKVMQTDIANIPTTVNSSVATAMIPVTTQITTIQGNVTTLQNSTSALQTAEGTDGANITASQTAITKFQTQLTAIQATVSSLQTALGNVNTSTLQTSITGLQTSLTTLQTELTADEALIKADEANIISLQNQANSANITFNTLSNISPASGTSAAIPLSITNSGSVSQNVPVVLTVWTSLNIVSGVTATLNGVAGTVTYSSGNPTTTIVFNPINIMVGANSIYTAVNSPVLVITLPTGTTAPTWSAQWSY
jgi:hypothetical protein